MDLGPERRVVEPYHARVRGAVLNQLDDDRRARHHRALAIASYRTVVGRAGFEIAQYRAALPGLDEHDTHLFAHAARDRLGRLIGGAEGAALRAEARSWLYAESVREPDTMLEMLLPGPDHSVR